MLGAVEAVEKNNTKGGEIKTAWVYDKKVEGYYYLHVELDSFKGKNGQQLLSFIKAEETVPL